MMDLALLSFTKFCFVCFEARLLGAYTFRIVLSSWKIDSHYRKPLSL